MFLDLLMLQSAFQTFMTFRRGYPLLDDDMKPKVVGPIAECLFAFDNVVKGTLLQDFEKALVECERKIEREPRGKAATEHVSA